MVAMIALAQQTRLQRILTIGTRTSYQMRRRLTRSLFGLLFVSVCLYTYRYAPGQVLYMSSGFTLRSGSRKQHLIEEEDTLGFSQAIEVDEFPLYSHKSKYQKIEVYKSEHFGKVLVLDGVLQLTQTDANTYNEMMAHIPMMQHPKPKRVLVIGGGDGYVVNEVLRHNSVEHVDHVDLDGDVIDACKKHFPWGETAWSDPRVTLTVGDGASFCDKFQKSRSKKSKLSSQGVRPVPDDRLYDVIIQDSSDPWEYDASGKLVPLPSGVLYSYEHFTNIHDMLEPESGIFSFQAESYNVPSSIQGIREWRNQALEIGFESVKYGTMPTVTYPTGQLGLLLCERKTKLSNDGQPLLEDIQQRFIKMITPHLSEETAPSFYHPRLQQR